MLLCWCSLHTSEKRAAVMDIQANLRRRSWCWCSCVNEGEARRKESSWLVHGATQHTSSFSSLLRISSASFFRNPLHRIRWSSPWRFFHPLCNRVGSLLQQGISHWMISCIYFSSKKRDFEAENELNQAHFVVRLLVWVFFVFGGILWSRIEVFYAACFGARKGFLCAGFSISWNHNTNGSVFWRSRAILGEVKQKIQKIHSRERRNLWFKQKLVN